MMFRAFASDFDGTLAFSGKVAVSTLHALTRLKATGCKLILVTGRELEDAYRVFAEIGCFDLLVLENGGLLYDPSTHREKVLGAAPLTRFTDALRRAGVAPLSVGRCVVATLRVYEADVVRVIREYGLDLRLIHNNESLMILPHGIDKGSGLRAALREFGISSADALGIGDAENDRELLLSCGFGVAVANATSELKSMAHLTTKASYGEGVIEVIERLIIKNSLRTQSLA